MDYKNIVARHLLNIKAVTLSPKNPYTWASGIKSPIYCDNRITLSHVDIREDIINGFLDIIKSNFRDVEVIAGTATAGIPHAAFIADRLKLPMVYIRSSSKNHGKNKLIEGVLNKNDKVLVIEDLISTGQSSIKACEAIRENGGEVLGVLSIFSYGLYEGINNFKEKSIRFMSITNFDEMIKVALCDKYIEKEEVNLLKSFQKSPKSYMV